MIDEKEYAYKVTAAGRVNIIGEHVDYCGGKVFPAALSLCNTVYVRPNGTDKINLSWTTLPDKVTLDINNLEAGLSLKYGNYQAVSALVWQDAGHKLAGCDMIQECTVPFGSGLSSSAAIEVSTIAALATVAGEKFEPVEVAYLAQSAERALGVNCGIMDQYASACGRAGNAMLLNCKTLECDYVPVNLGVYSLVIINCNKPHSLIESKYNVRRAETEEALAIIRTKLDVACLADVTAEQFKELEKLLPANVRDRAKHVIEECARVRLAETAMKSGDIKTLGRLLNESHASLRDLYEVTGRELDALAAAAQEHSACAGSRMTGGGFGGCTISLVKTKDVENFKNYVSDKFEKQIGYKPTCYEAAIADGITVKKV